MKKKFQVLLTCIICLLFNLSFMSCSDDDSAIEGGMKNSQAERFIGKWIGYGTWFFEADGTCAYRIHSFDGEDDVYDGRWSYNAEKEVLATTIMEWNWQILNITDSTWTGTHLGGSGKTYTYTRK